MKRFSELHPAALFFYFLALFFVCAFSRELPVSLCALACSVALALRFSTPTRFFLLTAGVFLVALMLNPLFVHRGDTVLFFINDNPMTLEATLYGLNSAAILASMVLVSRVFSLIFDSEKVLYLFGAVSPKAALVLSGAIRFLPFFAARRRAIEEAQKALGYFREYTLWDRISGGARVADALLCESLENGIVTADSMAARGYGASRRTYFSLFSFSRADVWFCLSVFGLSALTLFCFLSAQSGSFYPTFQFPEWSLLRLLSLISVMALFAIPFFCPKERV